MPRPRRVQIETGARLHFGLIASHPDLARRFGGIGLMVDRPGFRLHATWRPENESADDVRGDQIHRAERLLAQYRGAENLKGSCGPLRIVVERTIPEHSGWGSGTQLGMALATAMARLKDEPNVTPVLLAQRMGRGARSSLGIHGFADGGFLVDAGKGPATQIAPCISRVEFPSQWRFLLARPRRQQGLSGPQEKRAFQDLTPMPITITDRLCRIALLEILPSIHECDSNLFGASLHEFGRLVGHHFAQVQGHMIAHPLMRQLYSELLRRGISGVGQSSWGPGIWGFFDSQAAAVSCLEDLRANPIWEGVEFQVAAPRNRGASCSVSTDNDEVE